MSESEHEVADITRPKARANSMMGTRWLRMVLCSEVGRCIGSLRVVQPSYHRLFGLRLRTAVAPRRLDNRGQKTKPGNMRSRWSCGVLLTGSLILWAATGCSSTTTGPNGDGGATTTTTTSTGTGGTTTSTATSSTSSGGTGGQGGGQGGAGGSAPVMPNFSLADVNATSATYGANVSPRDHLEKVSGWFFGEAT